MNLTFENVLFCSAIAIELNDLRNFVTHTESLGVGNLDSSIRLHQFLISKPEIEEVVFIGSAGTYNTTKIDYPSFAIGQNYYYKEISVWKKESYAPELLTQVIKGQDSEFGKRIQASSEVFQYTDVNSPNSITLIDPTTLPQWTDSPLIENMEVFGLARLCSVIGKKFTSFFAITNAVGVNGSKDWNQNHKIMAIELTEHIKKALAIG